MKKAARDCTQGGFLEIAEVDSTNQQVHHVQSDEYLNQEEGGPQHHQNKRGAQNV